MLTKHTEFNQAKLLLPLLHSLVYITLHCGCRIIGFFKSSKYGIVYVASIVSGEEDGCLEETIGIEEEKIKSIVYFTAKPSNN